METTGQRLTDAYYAGYIDADGCIRFQAGTPRIEVPSVFPWVLEELMARFGGSVGKVKSKDRQLYRWCISGTSAVAALIQLLPHLLVKKAQARLVLEARQLPPGSQRNAVVAQVSALKHHNYIR